MTEGKEYGRAPEVDKAKWVSDLSESLRTYDMLGLWQDAEEVLRKDVVRSFVKKVGLIRHSIESLINLY